MIPPYAVDRAQLVLYAFEMASGRIGFISEGVRRWGFEPEDFLSGAIHITDLIEAEDQPMMDAVIRAQLPVIGWFYRVVTREGSLRWVLDMTRMEPDPETGQVCIFGQAVDVHDLNLPMREATAWLVDGRVVTTGNVPEVLG